MGTKLATTSSMPPAGQGEPCVYHEDCEVGLACFDERCEAWDCYDNGDCPDEHVCIDTACVPTQCREDVDCVGGGACTKDRQCVGATELPTCDDPVALDSRVLLAGAGALAGVVPRVADGRIDALLAWRSDSPFVELIEDFDAPELTVTAFDTAIDGIRFAFVEDRDDDGALDGIAMTEDWLLASSADAPASLEIISPLATPNPCAALRQDLDLDGIADLLVIGSTGSWLVFFDASGEVRESAVEGGTNGGKCRVQRGSLDGDAHEDLAWLGYGRLYRRNAEGSINSTSVDYEYGDFVLADLDGDGRDSILLYAGPEHPRFRLWWEDTKLYASPQPLEHLVRLDVDLDGRLDVVGTSDDGTLHAFIVGEGGLRCVASVELGRTPDRVEAVLGTDVPTLLVVDEADEVVRIEVGT